MEPAAKRTKHLWTKEEQRRLEDLLVEYPTERIEMQRFAKIAKALGTRTTNQVASRCQKYFKQLYLAGLPVPGRLPKSSRHAPYGSQFEKYTKTGVSTSFFPEFDVPVKMDDDSSDGEESLVVKGCDFKGNNDDNVETTSPAEDFADGATFQDHIKSLLIRLKDDKLKDENDNRPASVHENYSVSWTKKRSLKMNIISIFLFSVIPALKIQSTELDGNARRALIPPSISVRIVSSPSALNPLI